MLPKFRRLKDNPEAERACKDSAIVFQSVSVMMAIRYCHNLSPFDCS